MEEERNIQAVLNPICRGLVGYVSYLASCGNSTIYSEYLLYEPILRIIQGQNLRGRCEVPVELPNGKKNGDHKRIDFVLTDSNGQSLALEVKFLNRRKKGNSVNLQNDVDKLVAFNSTKCGPGYVLLFGPLEVMKHAKLKADRSPISAGTPVEWDAGRTKYAARWFRYV
jgi:hypothetical protein